VQVRCDFIFSISADVCTAVVVDIGASPLVVPTGLVRFISGSGGGSFTRGDTCSLSTSLPPANGQPAAVASPGAALCTVIFKPPASGPTAQINGGYLGDSQHNPAGAAVPGGPLSPAQFSAQRCLANAAQQITQQETASHLAGQGAVNVSFPAQTPGRLDASIAAASPSLGGGLAVSVNLPGLLARSARQVTIGAVSQTFSNPGTHPVKIKLTASARDRIRTLARRHRGLRISLLLRYTPTAGGAPITVSKTITVHARKPPRLLVLGQANRTASQQGTSVRVKLSAQARRLLRTAARRHQGASFLLYARAVNDGGQTVVASTIVTLPARKGQRGSARPARLGARTRIGCDPIPTGGTSPTTLANEQRALAPATTQTANALARQTPAQLATNNGFTIAFDFGRMIPVEKPPTLDSGALASAPILNGGQPTVQPPPPSVFDPGSLASAPILNSGRPV
jgi:hypothetical protein